MIAVKGVLMQNDGNSERPIAYESRQLNDVESRYSIYEQKLLAIIRLDFIVQLPITQNGNQWILIAIDYTTDWPLARVAQNAIHEVVTKFLNDDIVLNFGCPTEIITDRGNNFTINISNSYFKLIGIKYILISAYHSWSSGVIERFNHLFDSMIAKYVADNTINKWDQYVDRALFVCRIR
ncbi:unnamed protein product [Rotaria sordida]|uniref:Integrase catalytic domain-containing protein n=1 Tax=Rotaria sordida TaxID=392033 RepID=A0A818WIF4_9BILA|nr:unnamed protein product [Rotaria sordida]CAF3724428.1 unnamed protein product [Rotaria sordida]